MAFPGYSRNSNGYEISETLHNKIVEYASPVNRPHSRADIPPADAVNPCPAPRLSGRLPDATLTLVQTPHPRPAVRTGKGAVVPLDIGESMTNRPELYQSFAKRYHAGKRLRPAKEAEIETAESALGVLWPESFRQFALSCGALYCPSLLDLVVQRQPGYSDVQQFLTPRQTTTETRRWHLEPAGQCLAFASDSSGNWFAFRDLQASPRRPDDAAVWLFDHDDETVKAEAASFDEWLKRFLSL